MGRCSVPLLLQLAENDQVLILTMHHIVSDRWSKWILAHEAERVCTKRSAPDTPPRFPNCPSSTPISPNGSTSGCVERYSKTSWVIGRRSLVVTCHH
jgi:hypothetical protein